MNVLPSRMPVNRSTALGLACADRGGGWHLGDAQVSRPEQADRFVDELIDRRGADLPGECHEGDLAIGDVMGHRQVDSSLRLCMRLQHEIVAAPTRR